MLIEDRLNGLDLGDDDDDDENRDNQLDSASSSGSCPPKAMVVTNLASVIFEDAHQRKQFEENFLAIDPCATFNYFKSFSRVRVNFSSSNFASSALHLFDLTDFAGQNVRCFLTQPIVLGSGEPHLQPPKRERQFLISPPASPPVGWEPVDEAQPVINFDVLAAIADLVPGESHELHPPSVSQPGIVVHVCEEESIENGERLRGVRIPQTSRPDSPPFANGKT